MRSFFNYTYMILVLLAAGSCGGKKVQPDPTPADTRKLEITQPSGSFSWEGGTLEVKLEATFDYKVDIDVTWLQVKSSGRNMLVLDVEPNPEAVERSAKLVLSDPSDRFYAKTFSVKQQANPVQKISLNIVDKNATEQTKALFANLWAIQKTGFMFGHHDDLWYGRFWYNEAGRSDTKEVCGDYPAVFSVDFGEIMDDRFNNSANQIRRRVILEAYERGEVIMAVCHQNNPLTGGDSWDNKNKEVVKNILTEGSTTRAKYLTWLDRLADFANNLKGSDGKLVPVILRIYHEHTQSWSWWGSSCTTDAEFKQLWQFTVKYLRDTKGVHNFLYALSPQMDSWYTDAEASSRIVYRWPGDEYVDFMGIDCYHGQNPDAIQLYLRALTSWAQQKKKPCGVTENGQEGFTATDFWTRQVLEPVSKYDVAMVVMWRNKYVGTNVSDTHYYSVFPGHPSEENFRTMYDSPRSLFSKDLPDMYTIPNNIVIK